MNEVGKTGEQNAKRADIVWQTFRILLVKHACAFGHHDKDYLKIIFYLDIICLSQEKNVQHASARFCSGQTDEHCA